MGLFNFLKSNKDDTIKFGKHKGRKYSDLSSNYLEWLVSNVSNIAKLKAKEELEKRKKFSKINSNTIFGIITAYKQCWKCKKSTQVISLKFFESYDDIEVKYNPIIVYGQEKLPKDVLHIIQSRFPFYKSKYSYTTQSKYIANTCKYCNSLQGDFHLYEEPDGAFFHVNSLEPKYFVSLNNNKLEYTN